MREDQRPVIGFGLQPERGRCGGRLTLVIQQNTQA
jgi:hypothetical protein